MEKMTAHLKKEWKAYLVGLWMIGVSAFIYHVNGETQTMKQVAMKLSTDLDSVESILISTDGNVAETKRQVGSIASQMESVHKRVMRKR